MTTSTPKATVKKSIKPVKFTVELEVTKINENGTFSGVTILNVKSAVKGDFRAVSVPQAGGAIFMKADSLKGLDVIESKDGSSAPKEKTKLF